MSGATDRRWLLEVLRAGGTALPTDVAATLEARLADCTLEEAWAEVQRVTDLTPQALAQRIARTLGLPEVTPERVAHPDVGADAHLPPMLLTTRRIRVIEHGHQLLVATADPTDQELMHLLQFSVDVPVQWCVAPPDALPNPPAPPAADTPPALAGLPGAAQAGFETEVPTGGRIDVDVDDQLAPSIVRLGNQILREAVERRVSDVHVQPLAGAGIVRMRIDGVLHPVAALPREVMLRLCARFKLLAEMDPTNHLRPQDGRLHLRAGKRDYDLRLSSVPANGAEKLVIRVLGSHAIRSLQEVDVARPELDQLGALLSRGQGLLLMTGPTGSGKTTTLYSALAERNVPGVNIASVEDPVEIRLPGLAQIEVNPKAGLTFATALRSVLRQDPDILLVGEIRDGETAAIAVQASMTGHLVMATLHANDAVAALPRLVDLGVSPALLSQALAGSCAQRLVRRLCEHCAESVAIDAHDDGPGWLRHHAGLLAVRVPKGCPKCQQSGYRGRLPLNQVMEFGPVLAEMLERGEPLERLRAQARQNGMRSLAASALDRLRGGETSLDEVLRELGHDFWLDLGRDLDVGPYRPGFVTRTATRADPGDLPVMLIARDRALRERALKAFEAGGHGVVETPDALQGRLLLAQRGAVRAIVIDLTGLNAANVQALVALRDTLGGAAVPIFALHAADDTAAGLSEALAGRSRVVLRPRPADDAAMGQLIADAVAALRR